MELAIEEVLEEGIAAHRGGKLQDAERLYRAILQSKPKHPHANHNLGLLAVLAGKVDAALPLFETALEGNPKIEQFWVSYIDALIKEKQFENAKQILEQAKTHGVVSEKLNTLKVQLLSLSLETEPKPALKTKSLQSARKIKKTSEQRKKKKNLGRKLKDSVPSRQQLSILLEHYQNGRFGDAEELAASFTKDFPEHPFAWKLLGVVLKRTGRTAESLIPMTKATQLAPQDSQTHCNLGIALQELHRLDEAEVSYKKAIAVKPDYAEAYSNLGITLQQLNRLDEAEASYIQAIALKPDYAEVYCNFGKTLQELGKLNEAAASYTQAIALKPDYAAAHRHLTLIKRFEVRDEQYLKMKELYLDERISEEQRCNINFALAKACDDLENFQEAFLHYREGNMIRKRLLKYDVQQDVKLFEQLKSSYPMIEKNSLELGKISTNLMPIFIVGMPRSGTTLVEQIISSHSRVTGAGELNFAAQFGVGIATGVIRANDEYLLDFRHKYLNKLQNFSSGNLIVTDKMPLNFRYLGLLAAAFPEAKIVHVKRNPAAVCWANYKQYFVKTGIGYCYAIDDVVRYHHLYENLMTFWTKKLGARIYHLDYEELTVNQERETRLLVDYLNLDWEENCLSPQNNTRSVATTSNVQVRQKVYRGSSEQWKKYRPFLNGALDEFRSP